MMPPLSAWIKIDGLFGPVKRLVQFALEPLILTGRRNAGDIVVMKFFGMGSIIRLMSLCEEHRVDLSQVLLVTFSANAEVCRIWGVRGIFIETDSIVGMMKSSFAAIRLVSRLRPHLLVDFERVSNLAAIFRMLLAWQAGCKSVGFEIAPYKSPKIEVHDITGLTQHQIFMMAVDDFPKTNNSKTILLADVRPGKVIINVNTSNLLTARRYSLDSFAELIERLLNNRSDMTVLLTGTADERDYVQQLASRLDSSAVVNVAGDWTLSRYMTELADCELFITGDSAPLHLAASLNVPTLAIWGPTQPSHFGYQATPSMKSISLNMECSPCFLHPRSRPAVACNGSITCMRNIAPVSIATIAIGMMNVPPSCREINFPSKYVPVAANVFA